MAKYEIHDWDLNVEEHITTNELNRKNLKTSGVLDYE